MLVIVLLLPRLLRMAFPEVWVEDDFYLESAWLVRDGMRPYLDFVHPHMPLLEWFAAGYLKLFGTGHLSIELLNETMIFVTAVLTYRLGLRITDRRSAAAASILYSYSSLVFRYHMYERESFAAPLIILATIVALDDAQTELKQGAIVAIVFFLACAIKLTAVIPLVVIILYIATARRRLAGAIAAAVIFAAAIGAFSALLYWHYGSEFVFQTFLFHFLKGRTAHAGALYPRILLDLLAPLFILGCARIRIDRLFGKGVAIVSAIGLAEYAFYGLLSPTAWAHNYLEVLPFVAIIAGMGATHLASAMLHVTAAEFRRRREWITLLGGAALVASCLIWATPLVNENWLRGSVYGFGFISRAEIVQLATGLKNISKPDDEVIAPAFICFAAERREFIRYPETYGVYHEAKAEYERDGFFAARRKLGNADFFKLIADTEPAWTTEMRAAISSGKISAIVNDSQIQLLPIVYNPADFLLSNGFTVVMTTEHFRLWQRTGARSGK